MLKVINDKDTSGSIQLSGYGKDNQDLISYFIFILRCIALSILAYTQLPQYLPDPDSIKNIARTIQLFMEDNAWNAYVFRNKMDNKTIYFSNEYMETTKKILKDKMISSVFLRGCEKECSIKFMKLIKKHTL